MNDEKIWCHKQGVLSLQSYVAPTCLKEESLSTLQKINGFCYQRHNKTAQPWFFKSSSNDTLGMLFLADYRCESKQLHPNTVLQEKELWEFYCSCWQSYLSKIKGQAELEFYSPFFVYLDEENLLILPPLLQNFLLKNQSQQRYAKWVANYHHSLWKNEAALSYAFAVQHYELRSSKYFFSDEHKTTPLPWSNKPFIPLELRDPTATKEFSHLINETLEAHCQETLPSLEQWQKLNPNMDRSPDFLAIEKIYKKVTTLERKLKNKTRITNFWLRYRFLILGLSLTLAGFFLAAILIF